MSNKKLYECRTTFIYYAHAKSALEACTHARSAVDDADYRLEELTEVHEVEYSNEPVEWEEDSLIYGERNMTLGEAMSALPARHLKGANAEPNKQES